MDKYKEIKKRFAMFGVLVLMFFVGFGTGNYVKHKTSTALPANYTTKPTNEPFLSAPTQPAKDPKPEVVPKAEDKPVIDPANCLIKGNIAADGRKIYHVPGGASYNRLKSPKACFNTEAEAQAAGFEKAKR